MCKLSSELLPLPVVGFIKCISNCSTELAGEKGLPTPPCLQLDPEPLNRKRATHVLTAVLGEGGTPGGGGRLEHPWDTFFRLLDALDNFSPHLFQVGGAPAAGES